MKAILYDAFKKEWGLIERPMPDIDLEEALVRVTHAGLCGSDMHRIKSPGKGQEMFSLGHEIAGVVEQSPSLKALEGKSVVVNPITTCGNCGYCSAGQSQFCQSSRVIGKTASGGFAEYLSVPTAQIYVLPDGIERKSGILADGAAVIVNALSKIPRKSRQKVLVIGDGTLAALSLAVIRARNKKADLHISGRHPQNTDHLNAIYNSVSLTAATPAEHFGVVIETVGRDQKETFNLAVDRAQKGGTVLVLGVYPEEYGLEFKARQAFYKELSIFGVNSFVVDHRRNDFGAALRLIAKNPELFSGLVTHEIPLKNFHEGVELMNNKARSGAIKVVFCP